MNEETENYYMIDMRLPEVLDQELMDLVPQQRAFVNRLFQAGRMITYSLSLEKGRLWAIMKAESHLEILEMLSTMPIAPFVESEICPLTFHQAATFMAPRFSVN
jgi:muconolactone delta-isomerase